MRRKEKLPKDYYVIEEIRSRRVNPDTNLPEYEVKWVNWDEKDNTWQPLAHLNYVSDLIEAFEKRRRDSLRKNKVKVPVKHQTNNQGNEPQKIPKRAAKLKTQTSLLKGKKKSRKSTQQVTNDPVEIIPTKSNESPQMATLQQKPQNLIILRDSGLSDYQDSIQILSQNPFLQRQQQSELLTPPQPFFPYATRSKVIHVDEMEIEEVDRATQKPMAEEIMPFNWQCFTKGKVQIIDTWHLNGKFYYKVRELQNKSIPVWVDKTIFKRLCPEVFTKFLWQKI